MCVFLCFVWIHVFRKKNNYCFLCCEGRKHIFFKTRFEFKFEFFLFKVHFMIQNQTGWFFTRRISTNFSFPVIWFLCFVKVIFFFYVLLRSRFDRIHVLNHDESCVLAERLIFCCLLFVSFVYLLICSVFYVELDLVDESGIWILCTVLYCKKSLSVYVCLYSIKTVCLCVCVYISFVDYQCLVDILGVHFFTHS
jgi:hypothetical protein